MKEPKRQQPKMERKIKSDGPWPTWHVAGGGGIEPSAAGKGASRHLFRLDCCCWCYQGFSGIDEFKKRKERERYGQWSLGSDISPDGRRTNVQEVGSGVGGGSDGGFQALPLYSHLYPVALLDEYSAFIIRLFEETEQREQGALIHFWPSLFLFLFTKRRPCVLCAKKTARSFLRKRKTHRFLFFPDLQKKRGNKWIQSILRQKTFWWWGTFLKQPSERESQNNVQQQRIGKRKIPILAEPRF